MLPRKGNNMESIMLFFACVLCIFVFPCACVWMQERVSNWLRARTEGCGHGCPQEGCIEGCTNLAERADLCRDYVDWDPDDAGCPEEWGEEDLDNEVFEE